MAVTLETHIQPDVLRFHVSEPYMRLRQVLRALLVLVVGCVVLYFAPHSLAGDLMRLPLVGIEIWVGVSIYASWSRGFGTNVTLTVSAESLSSSGYGRGGYRPGFFFRRRCDLRYVDESQAAGWGMPAGLYAGTSCLLPRLTEEQAAQVMAAVHHHFPDTGSDSADAVEGITAAALKPFQPEPSWRKAVEANEMLRVAMKGTDNRAE